MREASQGLKRAQQAAGRLVWVGWAPAVQLSWQQQMHSSVRPA